MSSNDFDAKSVHYHPVFSVERQPAARSVTQDSRIALYVHIPFCATRCHFCTFAIVTGSSVKDELVESYLSALKKEMIFYAKTLREKNVIIDTIQIGGGTPTILSAPQLDGLLNSIFQIFDCSHVREMIVEGFPTTITEEKLAVFAAVDRLKFNLGIQTFADDHLGEAGRRHSAAEAIAAVTRAKQSGIGSVGVDIIFGLPFSSADDVVNDLDMVAQLQADHLAFYPLWVYGDTAIGKKVRVGALPPPDIENLRSQLRTGIEVLSGHGYDRYTAFHYTASEAHKHQYGLWQMRAQEWLGLGMAAMSYLDGQVYLNEANIRAYIDKINAGQMDTGSGQRLSPDEEMRFSFLYGLRLRDYPMDLFSAKFGRDMFDVFGEELRALARRELITYDDRNIALTHDGILALGNIEEFINSKKVGEPEAGLTARVSAA